MAFPLVSVIVPTFNRPELLHRALASIDAQTYRNIQTIVINDGGQDVAEIVSSYKKALYINMPNNHGLPAARNEGLKAVKGQWVAYLDDDDWYYPYHLETLVKYVHKARFVYSNADYIDPRGMVKIYMDVDPLPGQILSHNITPVNCVLHDRWLLPEVGNFDESLPNHEDWDLWIRMSKVCSFYHVKMATCCIDRSRLTMSSDPDVMVKGMLFVKARYRPGAPL